MARWRSAACGFARCRRRGHDARIIRRAGPSGRRGNRRIVPREITLLPGDGAGPELCAAARVCLDALGLDLRWDVHETAGAARLSPSASASLRRTGVALKGPTASAKDAAGEAVSIGAALRAEFDLFASVRPCRRWPGLPAPGGAGPFDLVVVRENSPPGRPVWEFPAHQRETNLLVDQLQRLKGQRLPAGCGLSLRTGTLDGARRVLDFACDYAVRHGRRRVLAIHKATRQPAVDGLWLAALKEVAAAYPSLECGDELVDNACARMVERPGTLNVLAAPSLYGDILADLATALAGGLPAAAGGHLGDGIAVFEPVHGCAAKLQGKDRANPMATMVAGGMLLRHVGEHPAAARLDAALAHVLERGASVREQGTRGFAQAVATALEQQAQAG